MYQYVAFDVPPGARAVSARLRYDRNRAVLDLGLLDPHGFRGWSGSNKENFAVTARKATPGYLPGPLLPGEWQILFGLHRIPDEGIDFEIDLDFSTVEPELPPAPPPRPERPPRRALPTVGGRRWLAGDLHSHTVHSDGSLTVAELACLARECGLDFLAVTDHNTISHHAELPAAAAHAGVLLVPGLELTTDSGHANCLGSTRWIDFRRGADEWLIDAEATGGLLSINHPIRGDVPWRQTLQRQPPLVEVWHSSWDRRGVEPLEWWRASRADAIIGGSDFHRFGGSGRPGVPTTWLDVEDDDILGALRAGRISISATPDAPIAVRREDELVVLDGAGTTLLSPDGRVRRIRADRESLPATPGLHRLIDHDGLTLSLTL